MHDDGAYTRSRTGKLCLDGLRELRALYNAVQGRLSSEHSVKVRHVLQ